MQPRPPVQGGWGGGGVGGGGGRGNGGGGVRGGARADVNVKGREEIRQFLNFYKRRNSVCVDLYQPAFYTRKPNWEDLAEFVYSVLAVGGTSTPQQIREAVVDIQLHPVKKLLFLKFADQNIRDEVATRLQAGLVWPTFATTVTGWGMDKPVERIRVLGVSPETDEKGVRTVLGVYGEVLETRKGFISKKLPGCTNGIWTVKIILGESKLLPPFLIMKEEGEVWQLATGELSVCWKCGQSGHIGDKCHQDVSALAASLSGPGESHQPSWAHVVRGASPQHPRPPPVPPYNPRVGVMGEPVNVVALRSVRKKLVTSQGPVHPPVRDESGRLISLGRGLDMEVERGVDVEVYRVVEMAVESVLEVTIDEFVKEKVGIFVDNFLRRLDSNIDQAVDRVLNETVDRSVLEALHEAIDKGSEVATDKEDIVFESEMGENICRFKNFDGG